MILILIALIACVALGIYGAKQEWSFLSEVACPTAAIFGFVGLFLYAVTCWFYIAAGHKAEILKREYGVIYTQEEIFYAGNVIGTIREIQRNRLEINGDLIRKD